MSTLTLAIPTLNPDPIHLVEALDSLRGQVAKHADRVSVVVVDNASDEEHAEFLRDCRGKFPDFRFVRQDENLGFDRNVLRLLDEVSSDFIWFFGDDDVLLAGGLDTMLRRIDENPDADVVLSQAAFFHETIELESYAFRVDGTVTVARGIDFVRASGFTAAALSTFCVATDAMRAVRVDFARGTNWVHFAALAQICSQGGSATQVLIDDNLVAVRRSNSKRWFANFGNQYRSGLTLVSMLQDGLAAGIDVEVYEFYRDRRFANNHMDVLTLAWPLSMSARRDVVRESARHFSHERRFRLVDVPLVYSPNWFKAGTSALIRAAGRAKRSIRG